MRLSAATECLGDVVGYGADPLPVTLLVMQRCKWTIQGNHDWGLFHELDDFNPLAREALFYTRMQLKPSLLRPRRRARLDRGAAGAAGCCDD